MTRRFSGLFFVVCVISSLVALPATAQTPSDYTAPTLSVSPSIVVVGQEFVITGTNWPPGGVTLTFNSTPIALGTATADQNGRFSQRATTPDVPLGVHLVTGVSTVTGVSVSTEITVVAALGVSRPAGPPLARTGGRNLMLFGRLGIALLACGGAAIAFARRRGRRQPAR